MNSTTKKPRGGRRGNGDSARKMSKADRIIAACQELQIKPEQFEHTPRIEHLFKGIADDHKLVRERIFEYLSGSEEPEARAVLELRAKLTVDEDYAIPFEAYLVAAGISTKKMFGILAAEIADQSAKATAVIANAMHPKVVEATIAAALHPLGDKDRKMLHQAAGFVPVPKNSVTHIHGDVDARTQTQNVAVLPPMEESIKRLSDRFNSSMTVPELPAPVEEFEDDEEEEES